MATGLRGAGVRARLGTELHCYIMVIPGVRLETIGRSVVMDGCVPCEDMDLRVTVWAYSPPDAMDRISEALTDLIAAENDGEIARVPDPGSG